MELAEYSESPGEYLSMMERHSQRFARDVYEQRLRFGVAREQARKDLPLSTYTEAVWKIDGNNLLKFLGQRLNPHAQEEIRMYAEALYGIVRAWLPMTARAFEDYTLDAHTFSGPEMRLLRQILITASRTDYAYAVDMVGEESTGGGIGKREMRQFLEAINPEHLGGGKS